MRISLLFTLLALPACLLQAQRNNLKPYDFEPLTSLPWEDEGKDMPLRKVLEKIFLEPDSAIRYPVLEAYLRFLPVEDLNKAFDICIALEGTQTPDNLVSLFLPIWAERDPDACWQKTQDLFRLVGIEDGWLTYDSWAKRPKITVQDLNAIRASRYWLGSASLAGFGDGVDHSELSEQKRTAMLRAFADKFIDTFHTWPGGGAERSYEKYSASEALLKAFREMPGEHAPSPPFQQVLEVQARRRLKAHPEDAFKIIAGGGAQPPPQAPSALSWPSDEFMLLWSRQGQPAMLDWVKSKPSNDEAAVRAKGILMSRVDAATCSQWIAEAKASKDGDDLEILLSSWARWDPAAALAEAIKTKKASTIQEVAETGAYGFGKGWGGSATAWNSCHHGMGVIRDFDLSKLPEKVRKELIQEWGITIMEEWGDIDVGEAARYGLDFMLRNDYAPRENLARFFGGEDVYPDSGDMIDRTFCALRVWAVIKPEEMEFWINSVEDPDIRKGLTWLLHNPWGKGEGH